MKISNGQESQATAASLSNGDSIYLNKSNPELFYSVPPELAFISGFYSRYSAVDHFPLIPWMILICLGMILGHSLHKHKPKLNNKLKENKASKLLEYTGKHSLEFYIVHWLVIYIIFCHIYPKYIREVPEFI